MFIDKLFVCVFMDIYIYKYIYIYIYVSIPKEIICFKFIFMTVSLFSVVIVISIRLGLDHFVKYNLIHS